MILTCDNYFLPIVGRSIETAEEGAASEELSARTWKFVRNANLHSFCALPTAILSVEKHNPLNSDGSDVVKGNPGSNIIFCVTQSDSYTVAGMKNRSLCFSINAIFRWKVGVRR